MAENVKISGIAQNNAFKDSGTRTPGMADNHTHAANEQKLKQKYRESSEDYLESILVLKETIGEVRSIDVVNKTGYSKPSISIAMKKLREKGHITMDRYGYIDLTESGLEIARRTYNRHKTLMSLLIHIGVDEYVAEEDACRIEHDLSDDSIMRLEALNRFLIKNPGILGQSSI